jgi:hypothetical protein
MMAGLRFAEEARGATATRGFHPANKKPRRGGRGFENRVNESRGRLAVVADGFHGAASLGFFAETGFLIVFGLLVDVAVAAVVIAGEVGRRRFTAKVTINALIVDEELAFDVLGELVSCVCHDRE